MGIRLTEDRYEEIKRMVVDLFERYDVHCVPVNGFELATKMGIPVIPYSAQNSALQKKMRNASEDGFSVLLCDGSWRIFYNDAKGYRRINYTLFHEIGHIVLDHSQGSELAEKEAQFFAKYSLVPPVLVHRMRLDTAEQIAEIFEVSYEAATYALEYYRKWLRYGSKYYTSYELVMLSLFDVA